MKKITFLLLGLFLIEASFAQKKPADLLIKSATIIDINTGKIVPKQMIAIKDGLIIAVLPESQLTKYTAIKTINARDKYVMPGLWDMHMHLVVERSSLKKTKTCFPYTWPMALPAFAMQQLI